MKPTKAIYLFLERFWITERHLINTISMKHFILIYISFLPIGLFSAWGQEEKGYLEKQKDSTEVMYYIVEGDTVAREMITLDEVILLDKLKFKSSKDRRQYLI